MPQRSSQSHPLKEGHSWKARTGYRIFVADRGAVRFDFPHDWIMRFDEDAVKFYDLEPPADTCTLAVSYRRFPAIDWRRLPVADLLRDAVKGDERPVFRRKKIVPVRRDDLVLAWTEFHFTDPREHREARSRFCLAFGENLTFRVCIQCLITLDYWPEDAARLAPVWDEVLRSLELGAVIEDPTRGKTVN